MSEPKLIPPPATAFRRLSAADLEVAKRLADSHRDLVAQLPPDSELRGLALRAGAHWERLGGLPRRDLRIASRTGPA